MLGNIRKRFHAAKYMFQLHMQRVSPWFMHERPVEIVWRRGSKRNRRGTTPKKTPIPIAANEIAANLEVDETVELDCTLYSEHHRTRKTGPYGKKELRLVIMELDEDGSVYSVLGAVTIQLNELVGPISHELKVPIECDNEIIDAVGQPYFYINCRSWYRQGASTTSMGSAVTSTGWSKQDSDSEPEDLDETHPNSSEGSEKIKLVDSAGKDASIASFKGMKPVPETALSGQQLNSTQDDKTTDSSRTAENEITAIGAGDISNEGNKGGILDNAVVEKEAESDKKKKETLLVTAAVIDNTQEASSGGDIGKSIFQGQDHIQEESSTSAENMDSTATTKAGVTGVVLGNRIMNRLSTIKSDGDQEGDGEMENVEEKDLTEASLRLDRIADAEEGAAVGQVSDVGNRTAVGALGQVSEVEDKAANVASDRVSEVGDKAANVAVNLSSSTSAMAKASEDERKEAEVKAMTPKAVAKVASQVKEDKEKVKSNKETISAFPIDSSEPAADESILATTHLTKGESVKTISTSRQSENYLGGDTSPTEIFQLPPWIRCVLCLPGGRLTCCERILPHEP